MARGRGWPPWLSRFFRYAAVGAVGVGVNFGVLRLVWPWLKGDPALAAAIATEVAILGNYALNARFTFRQPWRVGACLRYNLVMAVGGLVQTAVFAALVRWGWYYLVANLAGVACATGIGFAASNLWVFRRVAAGRARNRGY
jgi:putative flippase GtrA